MENKQFLWSRCHVYGEKQTPGERVGERAFKYASESISIRNFHGIDCGIPDFSDS